jgi:uncharacterized protein (DUF427 family)
MRVGNVDSGPYVMFSIAANAPVTLGIGKESVTSKPSATFPYVRPRTDGPREDRYATFGHGMASHGSQPGYFIDEGTMGLSWQQGPLSPGAIGRFLVPEPLPKRLLYAERLRRRMRVKFGGSWIADSEDVLLLFEPGHYPMAYFKETDVSPGTLQRSGHTTRHPDLGLTSWYTVSAGDKTAARGAWQHIEVPIYADELKGRIAFAWPVMDAFYEEDERIVGHAADSYHRIDIRQSSRNLVVRHRDRIIADTKRPMVLYESGFAPRWYVLRADIDESELTPVEHRTFCPYKGLCSYYDIGDARLGAWSYREAYAQVGRISDLVSFEPDSISVQLDGTQLRLEPGQTVIPHGPDRDLDVPPGI